MKPIISAFKASPDKGRGLARDFRIRWALEEVGQPYDVKLVIFESGAILLHIAEKHHALLPKDENARARAITWLFAALNTVEPPIVELSMHMILEREKPWAKDRLPMLQDRVRTRLKELAACLERKEWLDGEFSVADLMMVTVLRRLDSSGLLPEQPVVTEYIKRGEARPAYQRAFAAQLEVFRKSQKS